MLPAPMGHHTCFAGLSTALQHQLSLAADLSPIGGPMPYVSVLLTSLELPFFACVCLSTLIFHLPELWQAECPNPV